MSGVPPVTYPDSSPSCYPPLYPSLFSPFLPCQTSGIPSPLLDPATVAFIRQTSLSASCSSAQPTELDKLRQENKDLKNRVNSFEKMQAELNNMYLKLEKEKDKTRRLMSNNVILRGENGILQYNAEKATSNLNQQSQLCTSLTKESRVMQASINEYRKVQRENKSLLKFSHEKLEEQAEIIKKLKQDIKTARVEKKRTGKRKIGELEKEKSELIHKLSKTENALLNVNASLGLSEALLGVATDQAKQTEEDNDQIQEQIFSITDQLEELNSIANVLQCRDEKIRRAVRALAPQQPLTEPVNTIFDENQSVDSVEKYLL